MKQNKYEIDMCNGTIMDKLISFSLPLMLSGILQPHDIAAAENCVEKHIHYTMPREIRRTDKECDMSGDPCVPDRLYPGQRYSQPQAVPV